MQGDVDNLSYEVRLLSLFARFSVWPARVIVSSLFCVSPGIAGARREDGLYRHRPVVWHG
jgi:hypothetical protein